MEKKRKKQIGRPRKAPAEGERVQLSFRVTPDLKRRLDEVADQLGRSQSQEAELRLERSFERQDLLTEALSLRYGKEAAGILIMLAEAMEAAGEARMSERKAILYEIGRLASRPWPDDPSALRQGLVAGIVTLALLLPITDQRVADVDALSVNAGVYTIWNLGCDVEESEPRHVRERVEAVRQLLPTDLLVSIRVRCSPPSFQFEYRNLKAALTFLSALATSYAEEKGIDP
jgi:predicted transcriptional regulator